MEPIFQHDGLLLLQDLIYIKDGLLKVDRAALAAFNMVDEVMYASLHSDTRVTRGRQVAATRAIPLVMKKAPVERAAAIASQNGGILKVLPLISRRAGIVITGNEVFSGLTTDKFAPILESKLADLGSMVSGISYAPDEGEDIFLIQKLTETWAENLNFQLAPD